MDFEFYAGGIEDGIIEVLTPVMKADPLKVRELTTYSGQLDADSLKEALASDARIFPLVMVSYTGGESVPDPIRPAVMGQPLSFRHDCGFVVIVADDNPRGERARRRSKIYAMIAAVWETLTGVRLKTEVEGEQVLLNAAPLMPTTNEYIERLPDVTAYAVHFETAFRWTSPDRTIAGTPVDAIEVGVERLNASGILPGDYPGVKIR